MSNYGSGPKIPFSTGHIDYLQRSFLDSFNGIVPSVGESYLNLPPESIKLVKLSGISRQWQMYAEQVMSMKQLIVDTLNGLHSFGDPVIFIIEGMPTKISIFVGNSTKEMSKQKHVPDIVCKLLKSAYPGISYEMEDNNSKPKVFRPEDLTIDINLLSHAVIMTGTPTTKMGSEEFGVEQIERLIRGMYGQTWVYVVIAIPYEINNTRLFQSNVLSEYRNIQSWQTAMKTEDPLAKEYLKNLESLMKKSENNQNLWHVTSNILCQDEKGTLQARGIAQSVFGGPMGYPDPIRTLVRVNKKPDALVWAYDTPSPAPIPSQV